jgi:hypothetical protein
MQPMKLKPLGSTVSGLLFLAMTQASDAQWFDLAEGRGAAADVSRAAPDSHGSFPGAQKPAAQRLRTAPVSAPPSKASR